MWLYIVTFCFIHYVSIECPDHIVGCCVDHRMQDTIYCDIKKSYANRDSAFALYNKAIFESYQYINVKIDSMKRPLKITLCQH
jgi:hypothetical protein